GPPLRPRSRSQRESPAPGGSAGPAIVGVAGRGRPRQTSRASCADTSRPSAALHSDPVPPRPWPVQSSAQYASVAPPRAPASAARFRLAQTDVVGQIRRIVAAAAHQQPVLPALL